MWKKKSEIARIAIEKMFLEILLHYFIHIIYDVKIIHADIILTYLKAIKKTKTRKIKKK